MPRNLTDLPLNDDPQDTDWLLGASGISPAVFQKIPVGLVKAALDGKFDTPTGTTSQYIRGDGSIVTFPTIPTTSKTSGTYKSTNPVVDSDILLFTATTQTTIDILRGLKTTSGSCTISIQINGANVTGLSSLNVTSTPQNPTASGANVASVGQRVTLVISSVSSPNTLEFTLGATQSLT